MALGDIADTGKLIEVTARTGAMFVIPSWGFLEAIEIRFTPPTPNLDAARPMRLILEPIDNDRVPSFQVFARVRDVKDR